MNTGINTYTSNQLFLKLVHFSVAQNVMFTYLLTYLLYHSLTHSLTHLFYGAEFFLRS